MLLPVQADMRLLKMYESGLPAWAVFLARYGLWYRPWFRRAAYLAFIAISIFSMAVGFWDLYKNVPYVDQVTPLLGTLAPTSDSLATNWCPRLYVSVESDMQGCFLPCRKLK